MRGLAKRAIVPSLRSRRTLGLDHIQSRRLFASSSSPAPPPSSGIAALSSRRLLSVSGPDAAKFLQGIVTANVLGSTGLPRTDSFYNGFLNATGRVVHDTFVYPFHGGVGNFGNDEGFLIEVDAAQSTKLAKYIKRYKLRAKVDVREVSLDQATVYQAWNDPSELSLESDGSRIVLKDPRAPAMGYRIVQMNSKSPEIDLEQCNEEAYTIRRYLQGVPEGQDEIIREQALPLESNMDMMNGIDFRKGCYVGQELTIRTKHRGVVRKRILPCMVYDGEETVPQTLTYRPGSNTSGVLNANMIPNETSIGRCGKRGRSAGKWLKGFGNIGLGLCRLEIMTDIVLPGEQAAATYKEGDEFSLEWNDEGGERGVKVKAFVPDWLRAGLSEPH